MQSNFLLALLVVSEIEIIGLMTKYRYSFFRFRHPIGFLIYV